MRSLVTGGAGFIGAHVARRLLSAGHEVVVLDDLSGGFEDNVPTEASFIEGSVTDASLVDELFRDRGFEYVFHLAAYAAEGLSHFIRRFNYANNVLGSMNVINAAVRAGTVRRFVFTSSIAVYGAGQVPMSEDMTPEPEDPYGIAKYAVELDLKAAQRLFGLDYTIFRPHNVYGELQNLSDPYRNVLGIFMNQALQGRPMTIFGDGSQTRAFTHVDDVAPIIVESVASDEARNKTFNIGADTPYTIMSIANAVAHALGLEQADLEFLEPRNEVVHAFSEHRRLTDVFGRRDTVPLAEGLARMAAWAREMGAQETRPFSEVEVLKNLPPSWAKELTQSV